MMQAGIKAKVPFEVACGGNAECATCHCLLTKEGIMSQDYEEPDERELDTLDFCDGATDESRLACQTKVIKAFHGQTFRLFEMD